MCFLSGGRFCDKKFIPAKPMLHTNHLMWEGSGTSQVVTRQALEIINPESANLQGWKIDIDKNGICSLDFISFPKQSS